MHGTHLRIHHRRVHAHRWSGEDPVFIAALVNATRAAQATHRQEKLDALRNAVLNSVQEGAPAIDKQARFVRLVEEFTPVHLRLLEYLSDPRAWFTARGIEQTEYLMGPRMTTLKIGLPEFADDEQWALLVANYLTTASLTGHLSGMVSGDGMYDPLVTSLGRRFLAFITDPSRATRSLSSRTRT